MITRTLSVVALLLAATSLQAQPDASGCNDHPAFPRLSGFHIADCESASNQLSRFPVGAASVATKSAALEDVRGPYWRIHYVLNSGVTRPKPGQLRRDFGAATVRAGGKEMGDYAGRCKIVLDASLHNDNNCVVDGYSGKLVKNGKDVWAFMETEDDGGAYELRVAERESATASASTGAPVANEMLEKIIKDGFITLHINFDYNRASLKQDSVPIIVQIVEMLKLAPDLNIQVAGHTDSSGGAAANQKLSEMRADSVVKTLMSSGVPQERLSAKGHGESKPVADNKTLAGRAENRRVELIKL